MKILIVDQFETSQHLASAILLANGFKVQGANDSKSALKAFMREQFDYIFIRCDSKSEDTELINSIRYMEHLAFRNPSKIIATVKHLDSFSEGNCFASGATMCLEHPLSCDDLLRAVNKKEMFTTIRNL